MSKYSIKIENIVASASLGIKIPLEKMIKFLDGTEYEPEQFPGLVLRMKNPKVAFLLFSSGKIVCTGARKVKDVEFAIDAISKRLSDIGALAEV